MRHDKAGLRCWWPGVGFYRDDASQNQDAEPPAPDLTNDGERERLGRCRVERDGGIYRIVNTSGIVWVWASEENTARHVAAAVNHRTFPGRDCPCARCRRRAADTPAPLEE